MISMVGQRFLRLVAWCTLFVAASSHTFGAMSFGRRKEVAHGLRMGGSSISRWEVAAGASMPMRGVAGQGSAHGPLSVLVEGFRGNFDQVRLRAGNSF